MATSLRVRTSMQRAMREGIYDPNNALPQVLLALFAVVVGSILLVYIMEWGER